MDGTTAANPTHATILNGVRWMAPRDRDFVLFRIGMRFNGLRGIGTALQAFNAMPPMLRELGEHPALGLLHSELGLSWPAVTLTQYWNSFEELERYAADAAREHQPKWAWYARLGPRARSAGIFHETYRIVRGSYEAIYVNMPPHGLALAFGGPSEIVDARNNTARRRMAS